MSTFLFRNASRAAVAFASIGLIVSSAAADNPLNVDFTDDSRVTLKLDALFDNEGNRTGEYQFKAVSANLDIDLGGVAFPPIDIGVHPLYQGGSPARWSQGGTWDDLRLHLVNGTNLAEAVLDNVTGKPKVSVSTAFEAVDLLANMGPTETSLTALGLKINGSKILGLPDDKKLSITLGTTFDVRYDVNINHASHIVRDQNAVIEDLNVSPAATLSRGDTFYGLGSTPSFHIKGNLTNAGTIHDLNGTVDGNFTNTGTIFVNGGLAVEGTHRDPETGLDYPAFANTGELRVTSGGLSIAGDFVNHGMLDAGTGYFNHTDKLTNHGQMVLPSFSSSRVTNTGHLRIVDGGGKALYALHNTGTITHEFAGSTSSRQSQFLLYGTEEDPATLVNEGTYNITTDGHMSTNNQYSNENYGRIDNSGTFKKSGGEGTFSVDGSGHTSFHNTGTVEVTSGGLTFYGGGSSTDGQFVFDNGGQVYWSGNSANPDATHLVGTTTGRGDGSLHLGGNTTVTGTLAFTNGSHVEFRGGTLTGGTTTGDSRWDGGGIRGLTNTGHLRIVDGGGKALYALHNTGTITHEFAGSTSSRQSQFLLYGTEEDPATLVNEGTYNITTDGHMSTNNQYSNENYGRIDNSGTFKKSGGEGTFSVDGSGHTSFHNTGTVEVTSGGLTFYGGGSSTDGQFVFDNGGQVYWSGNSANPDATHLVGTTTGRGDGSLHLGGNTTVTGTLAFTNGSHVEFRGGTLTGGTTTGDSRWDGGGIRGLTNTGHLRIVDGGGKALYALHNTGTITHEFAGSTSSRQSQFLLYGTEEDPATLVNEGTYNITTDGHMSTNNQYSNENYGRIDNSGTFKKSGGEGTFSVDGSGHTSFHNTGTVEVTSGTLAFYGGFEQTGGQLSVAEGAAAYVGSSNSFTGGTITGTGTITGIVTNSGATVRPGNSPGTLTLDGNYTQGPDARLVIEIAGLADGEFDVLNVTGTATLNGGTLEVVLLDGNDFIPQFTQFDILQAGTLFGSFSNFILPTDPGTGVPLFAATPDPLTGTFTLTALQDITAVPEPTAALLLACGSLFLLRRHPRRQAA